MTQEEIIGKDKEDFFAVYYNQKIAKCTFPSTENKFCTSGFSHDCEDWHLVLKSTKRISKEDAVELLRLYGCIQYNGCFITEKSPIAKIRIAISDMVHTQFGADFLRYRSYLIAFRNYSPEQILKMGWCKIETFNSQTH